MNPDERHPLEGLLRLLPAEGLPTEYRDRLMFQAGRSSAGKWGLGRGAALVAMGLVAGFGISAQVFPGLGGPGRTSVASRVDQREDSLPTWQEAAEVFTLADREAWRLRQKVLAEGVEALPVSASSMLTVAPLSRSELIREVLK
ncbi:MAG: hypothetical protein FJ261_11370 [Planctomycetes bacterium]|nr:hypothetical protein [Planctomycetota bacterium]